MANTKEFKTANTPDQLDFFNCLNLTPEKYKAKNLAGGGNKKKDLPYWRFENQDTVFTDDRKEFAEIIA